MSIVPLPQFEKDLEAYRKEQEEYERLSIPKSMVVRFGLMRLIGEYPYSGKSKPGCGSKIIVRTHRGTEMSEMLTSTCPNAGCGKSVSRKEMLDFIENSGGKEYPFYSRGKVLRVATVEDMNEQSRLEAQRPQMRRTAQEHVKALGLEMKIVEAEPILGGERLTFYFMSEERVDFRELVQVLASEFSTRIEMRQVGARDEARLTADYERCGQHCCCKQFLKVLKPVSMRSAKQQKATLDPLKISGRCGRLMCCLRYEDESYKELSKKLPRMRKRIGTPYGIGTVVDRQILTQLVLVQLEEDRQRVAVPVEDIVPPDEVEKVLGKHLQDPLRGMPEEEAESKSGRRKGRRSKGEQQDSYRERSQSEEAEPGSGEGKKKRRRRRRRRSKGGKPDAAASAGSESSAGTTPAEGGGGDAESGSGTSPTKKRRRRRRRRRSGGGGSGGEGLESRPEGGSGGESGSRSEGGEGGGAKKKRRRRRRRSGGGEGGSGEGGGSSSPSGPPSGGE